MASAHRGRNTNLKSSLGHGAIYPLRDTDFRAPAAAVLMDLDGTTVKSEEFWIWMLEMTVAALAGAPDFSFAPEDRIFVSGYSVSEHLQYCLSKYCPESTLEQARRVYFEIARRELGKIESGESRPEAFHPAPGLKEFLTALREAKVRVGLVSSGSQEKVWPELRAAFRTLCLGNPLDWYDVIITAGQTVQKGRLGTLGEICAKPHPWLYAEALKVGLGISPDQTGSVVGIEDSAAGLLAIRLAGITAVGVGGGSIAQSGAGALAHVCFPDLREALPFVLGTNRG